MANYLETRYISSGPGPDCVRVNLRVIETHDGDDLREHDVLVMELSRTQVTVKNGLQQVSDEGRAEVRQKFRAYFDQGAMDGLWKVGPIGRLQKHGGDWDTFSDLHVRYLLADD